MRISYIHWATAIILACLLSPAMALSLDSMDFVKSPVALEAKNVLASNLLQGENYTVESKVLNDGLINTYRLSTKYGPVEVESTAELLERIRELEAMSAMEMMDKKKVFGESVVKGVKGPFQGVANLVKAPVDTTKSIVEGTGQFFSNIGRSIVSDDPHQDNVLKVAVGYDASKRAYAYEFGINPYSGFEPALTMLGSISQASVAGGITPRVAMASVGSDFTAVLGAVGTAEGMRKLVRDNPPGALHKINSEKLSKMGVSEPMADAFLNNYEYDPQVETYLVGALEQLASVKGREQFIAAAALASNRSTALLYQATAQLLAGYHARVAPLESLGRLGTTPYAKTSDNKAVFLLPLDYIFRTKDVQDKLDELDSALDKAGAVAGKELWITGKFDESAGEMLKSAGWRYEEKIGDKLKGE